MDKPGGEDVSISVKSSTSYKIYGVVKSIKLAFTHTQKKREKSRKRIKINQINCFSLESCKDEEQVVSFNNKEELNPNMELPISNSKRLSSI